jgi:hypothetical protein
MNGENCLDFVAILGKFFLAEDWLAVSGVKGALNGHPFGFTAT